jgi:hypothetical protein
MAGAGLISHIYRSLGIGNLPRVLRRCGSIWDRHNQRSVCRRANRKRGTRNSGSVDRRSDHIEDRSNRTCGFLRTCIAAQRRRSGRVVSGLVEAETFRHCDFTLRMLQKDEGVEAKTYTQYLNFC